MSDRTTLRRAVPLALFLVAAGSCGGSGRPLASGNPFSPASDRPNQITLEVTNLNFNDARLYAVSEGRRITLGTVGGRQDATFHVPWTFSQILRIEINLLAGPTCITEDITADPGDILELQIQSVFGASSFCR